MPLANFSKLSKKLNLNPEKLIIFADLLSNSHGNFGVGLCRLALP